MRKLLCTKLLVCFSINILATPLLYCGKRKHIKMYGKKSKSFLRESKLERKRRKEKRIKQAKQHEKLDRKIKKIKFRPAEGDALELSKQFMQTIEQKGYGHVFGAFESTLKRMANKKRLPKKLAKLALLDYLLGKVSACLHWYVIYEDEEKIIEECCTTGIATVNCDQRTKYKKVQLLYNTLSALLEDESPFNSSQATNVTCSCKTTSKIAPLIIGVSTLTGMSIAANIMLAIYICICMKSKKKSNEELEETIEESTSEDESESRTNTEDKETESSTEESSSETTTES